MLLLPIIIPTKRWVFVQKKLPYITKELFLGKDATICTFYPSIETMEDAILHTFVVPKEDIETQWFFLQA
jgi:hypothetical protein